MRRLILILAVLYAGTASAQAVSPAFQGFDGTLVGDLSVSGDSAFGAGISWQFVTIASVDTLDATHYVVSLDASGGDFALTLPAASTTSGRAYVLIVSGASGTVTLTPDGADTIEGAATLALDTQFTVFDVYSDGVSDWAVQAEDGGFSGDLNGNDLSDSSDNLVTVSDPMATGVVTATAAVAPMRALTSTSGGVSLALQHTAGGGSQLLFDLNPINEGLGPFIKVIDHEQFEFGNSHAAKTTSKLICKETLCELGGDHPSTVWDNGYFKNLISPVGALVIPDVDGLEVTGGPITLTTQNLVCTAANSCSVGSIGVRWNSVYASDLISDRISQRAVGLPVKITEPDGLEVTGATTLLSTLQVDGVAVSHKEGSAPSATTDYGTFFSETATNILSWIDPDGTTHEVGGVSAAYTSMWFHGAAVTTTITTEDTLVKVVHFENVGIEARLVADPTTDDDITIPAGLDGDYLITIEASVTPSAGNNQEILLIPAITLATPLVITDATNTTPIVITSTAHGLMNGDAVQIVGVGGNTAANGNFNVSSKADNTFELEDLNHVDVAGTGAYTSGGTVTIIYMGAATIETQVSTSDLSRSTSSGTHALAASDTITAYVANNSSTNNISFEQLNLSVVKISD